MSRELGLVAHYGAKTPTFEAALTPLQKFLSDRFTGSYTPRDSFQVHATILYLGKADEVDPEGVRCLAREWQASFIHPLHIQFGGIVVAADPGIDAMRTFDVARNWCLVHGWPIEPATNGVWAKNDLAALRRSVERFGFRHLYRDVTPFGDPNCYTKVGYMNGEPLLGSDLAEVRGYLAARPFHLDIGYQDLVVVGYEDDTLPPTRTVAVSLAEVAADERAWDALSR
ncbi:hypothetical protein [Actinoplanes sp. M2I2]|uniref:hypothetical protein n=1 Tax=Actinoplanes sp. M2I2 TaxID=1734444 RepID=UPI0020220983|nr:hypothetical protein [Actinoplanes sp. M2I2]